MREPTVRVAPWAACALAGESASEGKSAPRASAAASRIRTAFEAVPLRAVSMRCPLSALTV